MSDDQGYRSSQEYSGTIVEVDDIAVSTKKADIMAAMSSGFGAKMNRNISSGLGAKQQREPMAQDDAPVAEVPGISRDPKALSAVLSSGIKAKQRREADDSTASGKSGSQESPAAATSSTTGANANRQDQASKNPRAHDAGFF